MSPQGLCASLYVLQGGHLQDGLHVLLKAEAQHHVRLVQDHKLHLRAPQWSQ